MFQFNFYCLKKMFFDLQRKMTLLFHLILKTNKNNPLCQSQHLKWINKHDAFSSLFLLYKWGLKIVFLALGWKSFLVGPNSLCPLQNAFLLPKHSWSLLSCWMVKRRPCVPGMDSSSLSQLYRFLVSWLLDVQTSIDLIILHSGRYFFIHLLAKDFNLLTFKPQQTLSS